MILVAIACSPYTFGDQLETRPDQSDAEVQVKMNLHVAPITDARVRARVEIEASRNLCRVLSAEKTGFRPRKCPFEVPM